MKWKNPDLIRQDSSGQRQPGRSVPGRGDHAGLRDREAEPADFIDVPPCVAHEENKACADKRLGVRPDAERPIAGRP